jgi:hypothetical protein
MPLRNTPYFQIEVPNSTPPRRFSSFHGSTLPCSASCSISSPLFTNHRYGHRPPHSRQRGNSHTASAEQTAIDPRSCHGDSATPQRRAVQPSQSVVVLCLAEKAGVSSVESSKLLDHPPIKRGFRHRNILDLLPSSSTATEYPRSNEAFVCHHQRASPKAFIRNGELR